MCVYWRNIIFIYHAITLSGSYWKSTVFCNAKCTLVSSLRGGVQGQKSWKHDFEITGDPKGPPSGSTFGRVLSPQTNRGTCGVTTFFSPQKIGNGK